jgi:hypothetical protein
MKKDRVNRGRVQIVGYPIAGVCNPAKKQKKFLTE